MDEWEKLRETIETESNTLIERVETWKKEALAKIEVATKNELLIAVKQLGVRLAAIEDRLPDLPE
jgi:hypothetical protein